MSQSFRSTKEIRADIQKVNEAKAQFQEKLISLGMDEEAVKVKAGEAVLEGNIYDIQTALDKIRHERDLQEFGIEAANHKLMALEGELSNSQSFENRVQWERIEAGIWPRVDELEEILINLKTKCEDLKTDLHRTSSSAHFPSQEAAIRVDNLNSVLHRLNESLMGSLKDLQQYKAGYKKG